MPPTLKIELLSPDERQWLPVGQVGLGDPDGSVSDNTVDGRNVYQFGVDPIENQGYILRSRLGIDTATQLTREIDTTGFETIARLAIGQTHEMTIRTDVSPTPKHIRFTYSDD